jgi:hypothetical protein
MTKVIYFTNSFQKMTMGKIKTFTKPLPRPLKFQPLTKIWKRLALPNKKQLSKKVRLNKTNKIIKILTDNCKKELLQKGKTKGGLIKVYNNNIITVSTSRPL